MDRFLSIYHTTGGGMIDRLLGFTSWIKKKKGGENNFDDFEIFFFLKFRKSAILEMFLGFVDLKISEIGGFGEILKSW